MVHCPLFGIIRENDVLLPLIQYNCTACTISNDEQQVGLIGSYTSAETFEGPLHRSNLSVTQPDRPITR